MKQKIQANAQKYLKTPNSPVLAMVALKSITKETMELYWAKTQKEGFAVDFCGEKVKLHLKSNKMPFIIFSSVIDAQGEYNSTSNAIILNTSLLKNPEALYTTLVHEITHAMQYRMVEEKEKYPTDSVEYNLLAAMEMEIGQRQKQNCSWQGIDFGNRIYCAPGMKCKGADQASHVFAAPRVRAFYNMLETERQARLMEIEWAKESGICSQNFIRIQEERYNTNLESLQDIFETEFLSKKATLSAFQYAQVNLANQAIPDKNKIVEIDMTYELAQMSALFNGKITLSEFNQNIHHAAKEEFCAKRYLIANTRDPKMDTIPIMPSGPTSAGIANIPIQAPISLAYELMANPEAINYAREEQLNVLFAYMNQPNNFMLKDRMEEVLGDKFETLNNKHLALYKKAFMTPAQTEQYYTSKFSFDLSGQKSPSNVSATQSQEEHAIQQDR